MTKYFVGNENCLVYPYDDDSLLYVVLKGSILRGYTGPQYGFISLFSMNTIREATRQDFDDYGICSHGYFFDD